MSDTFRAMCKELLAALKIEGYVHWIISPDEDELCIRADALLAQSEPEGVSADEWDALVERAWDKYKTVGHQGELFMYDSDFGNALDFVRKELAPPPHPTHHE
jgi:hypothetical protein